MGGELLRFPETGSGPRMDFRGRVERLATLIQAIDAGELLSALPDCPLARRNHLTAMDLLAMAQAEIGSLCRELAPSDA